MTTAPARSGVSSRSRGPETFETGLHADAEFGTIEVGLAVDGGTFGLVIDAPVVGQLRVAFDVAADGVTRLSSLARRNVEGVEMQVIVVDETRTRALEAEMTGLRASYEALQSQSSDAQHQLGSDRDQALARIASLTAELEQSHTALADARAEAAAEVTSLKAEHEAQRSRVSAEAASAAELAKTAAETEAQRLLDDAGAELSRVTEAAAAEVKRLEAELEGARAAIQAEKETAQTLLAERDQTRADLERLRGELDSGSASLMGEVNEARAARDAVETERGRLAAELETRQQELAASRAEAERLTTELASARSAQESDLGQLSKELEETRAAREQAEQALADTRATLQTELEQRGAEVTEARATRERLERELDDARALLDGDRTSAEQSRLAMRDVLVEKEQALAATAAERHRLVQAHADELAAAQAREESIRATLAAAEADHGQLTNDLAGLRDAWEQREIAISAELDALRSDAHVIQATLAAREEAFAQAVEQRDGAAQERDQFREQLEQLSAQLQTLQAAVETQQQAAAEAHRLATQHQTQAATLVAERDEARNVARGLHQRIAGGAGVEAIKAELATLRGALDTERQNLTGVVSERDRAMLQVEALGRQLDLERSARAKAVLERDQYRDRFKVLTTSQGGSGEMPRPTITSEDTKAYSAQRTTTGEVSTEGRGLESPTDLTQLPHDDKKKEH